MGDVPSTTNQAAQEVDAFIRSAVFGVVLKAAKADLVLQFPFLGWPIVSSLVDGVLNSLGNRVYTRLAQAATFQVIDMQTDQERANYKAAVVGLHVAQASANPETIARAQDKFRESLARLIHFDGSATP